MLTILQVIVSVIIIVLILVQERSSGLSGAFGGGSATPYQTRRGMEKGIFAATIISAVVFLALAVINLVV